MSLSSLLRKTAVGSLLVAAIPVSVSGQANYATNGSEYAVAGNLPGDQVFPRLSLNASGGFLVWQDNVTDGDGLGVSAVRLDSTLSAAFSGFRVNQQGAGDQEKPDVALLNDGGAVFVWQSGAVGAQHIYARFLSPSNLWSTGDVLVNTFTNTGQVNPAVATLAGGNVVVAWSSLNQASATSMQDVYAQLLSPAGPKVGGEFRVNQFTSYNQRDPAVAALPDGRFILVWVSEQERFGETLLSSAYGPASSQAMLSASVDIYARLFSAGGVPAGDEFLVNTSSNLCANPRVSVAADGTFLVAWSERDLTMPSNGWDIWARPFSSAGVGGAARRVNTYQYGDQYQPQVSVSGTDYLVIWTSLGQDGSWEGVYGQFLQNDGSPSGSEFRVNTTTVSRQMFPAVASAGTGRFLAVWSSFTGGPTSFDLYAQRYVDISQPLPALGAPFVNAPFLVVTGVYQPQLVVSWPALAGLPVADYDVYVDGAVTPTAVVTTNQWTLTGIAPGSTHSFQVAYDLANGRHSPMSPAASGVAWNGLSYGGIPYEWMMTYFGSDIVNWPKPTDDPDHDGMTLLQEFLAGTDPTDPASALRAGLRPTAQGLFLDWNTHAGFIYQVQTAPTPSGPWADLGTPRFAAGTTDSLFVGGGPTAYYRVVLRR